MRIKKKSRSEHEFRNLTRRLELALEASQIGVWEHNLDLDEIIWDTQMHRLYGTTSQGRTAPADYWLDIIHPDDKQAAISDFYDAVMERGFYESQFRIILPTGEIRYISSRALYFDEPGHPRCVIGVEWDVTKEVLLNRELADQKSIAEARAIALERSKAKIEHAANHDYLTGLPNRRCFDRTMRDLSARKDVATLAVIHVDLDRFKQINDKYGHAAGDFFLKSAARELFTAVPGGNFVARIGGDEFMVILINPVDRQTVETISEDILSRLAASIEYGDKVLEAGASVGVSLGARKDAANLLAESDLALYQAKFLGRNRVEFFTARLQERLQQQRQLVEDLRLALEQREIVPFYQVQVDAQTGDIVGLEALARWRHPAHGLLMPAAFMKIADEQGLTAQIDAAILERVLFDRVNWLLQGISVPRIAVNISSDRLNDPSLIERLGELDIPDGAISFELVETIFLDETDDVVISNIETIKKMGIEIEIDDFGSGHASLIGLMKLRPKRLKIDRQLITTVTTSDEQRRLIASIVEIAKALNVEIVAEGVETPDHARLLAELGCETLQGYAFGFPISNAEMMDVLRLSPVPLLAAHR